MFAGWPCLEQINGSIHVGILASEEDIWVDFLPDLSEIKSHKVVYAWAGPAYNPHWKWLYGICFLWGRKIFVQAMAKPIKRLQSNKINSSNNLLFDIMQTCYSVVTESSTFPPVVFGIWESRLTYWVLVPFHTHPDSVHTPHLPKALGSRKIKGKSEEKEGKRWHLGLGQFNSIPTEVLKVTFKLNRFISELRFFQNEPVPHPFIPCLFPFILSSTPEISGIS